MVPLLVVALLAIGSGYKLLEQSNAIPVNGKRDSRKIPNTKKEPLIPLSPLPFLEDTVFCLKIFQFKSLKATFNSAM